MPQDAGEEAKRTNEIKMAVPSLDAIDIQGKDITADALLTQRTFAKYIVERRNAHYHFTVKGNQPTILESLKRYFEDRQEPDFQHVDYGHGRIETRKIWTTTELNEYINFPHLQQAYAIERDVFHKKTGKFKKDVAYCITSRAPEEADAKRLLTIRRGHWSIENGCHNILDWTYDEDRSRISKGYGPENMTRLRRFSISLVKSKGAKCVAEKLRQLNRNTRMVFDYLKMTRNSNPRKST